MSQENVAIWRANLEALLAQLAAGFTPEGTISTLAEIWDPHVELDATDANALDLNRVYRGPDEVRRFWQEWFSAWETLSFDYELLDAGERVVMLVDMQMRGRSTGIEVPFGKFAWVSTFRDGLVVHTKLYMRQSKALEASGLPNKAMSQENVETVARLYNECWGLGNLDLVPEILHPDIVWTAIESAPDSGTRRGQVECRAYMNDWLESFDLKAMPIEEARSAPDGVLVCALHGVGTEKRTGLTTDMRYGAAFRFAPDGRLVDIHEYATHQEALEAVGLQE